MNGFHRWLDDNEIVKLLLLLTICPIIMVGLMSMIRPLQLVCLGVLCVIAVSRWWYLYSGKNG